jgi:hypothetical protein
VKNLMTMLAVVAILGVVGGVALAEGDNPAVKTLKGVVVKADVKDDGTGTVTVTCGKGEAKKEVAVAVDAKTVVTIEGKEAKAADLKAGQHVVVTPDTGTATKIEVPKPREHKQG